jgi:hypothetical protein
MTISKKQIEKIIETLNEDIDEAQDYLKRSGATYEEMMKCDSDTQYETGVICQSNFIIAELEKLIK